MSSTADEEQKIVQRPVSALKPHPQRDLFPDVDPVALEMLVADIAKRGIVEPLVATETDVLLSGHQRRRAAEALGLAQVPVIVKAGLNEVEQLRHLLQENLRRRHMTPSQRAVLAASPALKEVVEAIAGEAAARRARGGAEAGRGGPKQLEAALPQAKGHKRAPQTRDVVADLVGVKGRLVSEARYCWEHAREEVEAVARGESGATVSAIARRARRAKELAEVKEVDTDITELVLPPGVAASGEYVAKFCGITHAGKEFVAAWQVMLGKGIGSGLLLQRLPDGRHPDSGRLGRQTPLGATVAAITGSSEAKVDVRPVVGHMFRLCIAVKGKAVKIENFAPIVPNADPQVVEERPTTSVTPEPGTKDKRDRSGRPAAKSGLVVKGRRPKTKEVVSARSESDPGASPASAIKPGPHSGSGRKKKRIWA